MTTLLYDRIQAAYANDSSDSPARGFDDVLRRRDRGEYVELGVARKRVRMRYWVAAAAAGVAWVAFGRPSDDPITPQLRSAHHSVFLPDLLIAQAAENPAPASDSFAIRSVDGSLLKPGTWVYRRRPIGGAAGRPEWDDSVTIRAGVFNEEPAWLLIASRGSLSPGSAITGPTDTVWVRQQDLWPLARSARLVAGYTLRTIFTPDSTVAVFDAEGETKVVKAGGISPANGVAGIGEIGMRTLLQVVSLSPDWRGSVRVIGIYNSDWPLRFKVYDSETITVPAGTFDCWKVGFDGKEPWFVYWISKREHWIVRRALDQGGIQYPASEERVLVSALSGEP